MSNTGHGTRRITNKVWRGILIMWRNPQVIWYMKDGICEDDEIDGLLPDKITQKDVDCVIRAIDWARAMERRF
jgi:hypothetical protein